MSTANSQSRSRNLRQRRRLQDHWHFTNRTSSSTTDVQDQNLYDAVFEPSLNTSAVPPAFVTWSHAVHKRAQLFAPAYFMPILQDLGYTLDEAGVIDLVLEIITLLQNKLVMDMSIDAFSEILTTNRNITTDQAKRAIKHGVRQAIFAVIGLLTMLYVPATSIITGNFTIDVPSGLDTIRTQQSCDSAQNRLSGFLKGFGKLVPFSTTPAPVGSEDTPDEELFVSKLTYFSLRNLSQLNIIWTNDLGSHLYFNEDTHDLMLFRLTSFCLSHVEDHHSSSFFCRFVAQMYPIYLVSSNILYSAIELLCTQLVYSESSETPVCNLFVHEVLLTYRMIFGQERGSRKLFKSVEKRRAAEHGLVDPFLNRLCCYPSIDSNGPLDNRFVPSDVYRKNEDFPIFGERLLSLQSHISRQNPSKLLAIWKDRRNPLNFFNLWAVIVFGVLTLLLGTLQLIVGIVALVVAYKQLALTSPLPTANVTAS